MAARLITISIKTYDNADIVKLFRLWNDRRLFLNAAFNHENCF